MKKLLDLRFVIGLFFVIVGALLVIYYFINPNGITTPTINITCGSLFILFGAGMIFLSYFSKISEE